MPKDHYGLISGGKIIFPEFQLSIQPMLLSPNNNIPLEIKISNLSDKAITTPRNFSTEMSMITLKGSQELKIELAKIMKKSQQTVVTNPSQITYQGLILLTTAQAQKFSSASAQAITLQHDPNLDLNSSYSQTQLNLLEMAHNNGLSSKAYMLIVDSQERLRLQCFAFENMTFKDGIDKKTYFPTFINNMRVIACADSGSDLTLMQFGLFKKIFKYHKNLIKKDPNLTIKNYSNNELQIIGQCPLHIKFKLNENTIMINLTIVHDINAAVPVFLFGNDSLRKTLATITYTGDVENPTPEIIVRRPNEL